MSLLKKASFTINSSDAAAVTAFINHLSQLDRNVQVRVTIEVMEDIARYKKRYFAMVTELAKYAGYCSHKEREMFKEQIRNQIHIRSMTDIDTAEEAMLAIEAIHQIAAEHYKYTFKPDGTFISFNNPDGRV